jgi:L-rhamnose-H+ transport protein
MTTLLGGLFVAAGGLLIGAGAWPMKIMRKYQFEHWWFLSMLVGLVLLPWAATLFLCPNAVAAYHEIPATVFLRANLFSLGWGVANVLCGLCYVRIGFALTGGILTGLGVSIGVTVPLIIKGTGLFSQAPNLNSPAGHVILFSVAIILCSVVLGSLAGFGRERAMPSSARTAGSFRVGLVMVVIAGILSVGLSFSFVFSQDPIVHAMRAHGAGYIGANFAVWAMNLLGGAVVNLAYPAYLMTKNHSWGTLFSSPRDAMLALIIGVTMAISIAFMGEGMLLLGALGASVGFGIQQSSQMLANQSVGFLSGEWKGVQGRPRTQQYLAILLLLIATSLLAYGNMLGNR